MADMHASAASLSISTYASALCMDCTPCLQDEFVIQRTAALVDQHDDHIPSLTVAETLAFARKCQVGPHGGGTGIDLVAALRDARRKQAPLSQSIRHLREKHAVVSLQPLLLTACCRRLMCPLQNRTNIGQMGPAECRSLACMHMGDGKIHHAQPKLLTSS